MIEFTASARQRLEDYLGELRRVLGECPTLDPIEVERDVQDHIQSALSTTASPVDDGRLDEVLRSLGAPSDWVQDQRVPWFKRPPAEWWQGVRQTASEVTHKIAAGPESYRLPYLSLLTLTAGVCATFLFPAGILVALIALLAAFVLARAAIAAQGEQQISAGQMWLIAPALLLLYVPLAIGLVGWPIVTGMATFAETDQLRSVRQHELISRQATADAAILVLERRLAALQTQDVGQSDMSDVQKLTDELARIRDERQVQTARIEKLLEAGQIGGVQVTAGLIIAVTLLATGFWWLAVGVALWWHPGFFRSLFRPFIDAWTGRGGLILAGLGGLLLVGGLAVIA
ncbi:MAG: hypothetical protein KDA75_20020 [Planctomycetaceae bacterium]|nr:hypothetical protein [Planctomycetaceae bacterium]